jgi:uroporphyrinogen-III synthase
MTGKDQKPVLAIMRPEGYLKDSVKMAESFGFDTVAAPMIEIVDMRDDEFDSFVKRVLGGRLDYVIFTSANGIDFTLRKIPEDDKEAFINALKSTNVIAIGPNTQKALMKLGIEGSGMPDVYSSEGLVEYLCPDVKGKTVDVARSSFGATLLISGLNKCGASVFETQVYTLARPEGDAQKDLLRSALDGKISVFAFTSSMMVRNFFAQADEIGAGDRIVATLNDSLVSAIGIPTAKTLKSYGVDVEIIPERYTFEAMLGDVRSYISNNP